MSAAAPARTNDPRAPLTADAAALRIQMREAIKRAGWSEIARRSGVERTALHRAFTRADHVPSFVTVAAVAQALGLRLRVVDESCPL